jgi:antitoxin YefM
MNATESLSAPQSWPASKAGTSSASSVTLSLTHSVGKSSSSRHEIRRPTLSLRQVTLTGQYQRVGVIGLFGRFRNPGENNGLERSAKKIEKNAFLTYMAFIETITYTEARDRFVDVLNRAEATRDVILITRRGHADVALIAEEELSSLQETAHLLRSSANARRLLESLARSMAGPVPAGGKRR